jgi:hypothetical protein
MDKSIYDIWEDVAKDLGGRFSKPLDAYSFKITVSYAHDLGKSVINVADLWGSGWKSPSIIATTISTKPNFKIKDNITIEKVGLLKKVVFQLLNLGSPLINHEDYFIRTKKRIALSEKMKQGIKDFDDVYIDVDKDKNRVYMVYPKLLENKTEIDKFLHLNNEIIKQLKC